MTMNKSSGELKLLIKRNYVFGKFDEKTYILSNMSRVSKKKDV